MNRLVVAILAICCCFSLALASCTVASQTEETSAQSLPPAYQAQIDPPPAHMITPTPPEKSGQLAMHDPEVQESPSGGQLAVHDPEAQESASDWKIAIVTRSLKASNDELTVEAIQNMYGQDRIIHSIWPDVFVGSDEMRIRTIVNIAANPEVKALVISPAIVGTNEAVARFREVRDDVFIVYCHPSEEPDKVAELADLILAESNLLMGKAIAVQAKAMGAETLIHYSFPRHMAIPPLARRRDVMQETAEREGLKFVELTAPDPREDGGVAATQLHITRDVPLQVELYGKNTAFFGTTCTMQIPLVTQVVETGALFPQACCPSPYQCLSAALQVVTHVPTGKFCPQLGTELQTFRPLPEVLAATRVVINARGATGRFSSWPAPTSMAWPIIGAGYAIEWLEGNVPQERGVIDLDVISRLCMEYTLHISGAPIGGVFEPFDHEGLIISHFIEGILHYLTY